MTHSITQAVSFNQFTFAILVERLGEHLRAQGASSQTDDLLAFRGVLRLFDDLRREGRDPYSDQAVCAYRALYRHEVKALRLMAYYLARGPGQPPMATGFLILLALQTKGWQEHAEHVPRLSLPIYRFF